MDGIAVTLYKKVFHCLDKWPESTVAVFEPPGQWTVFRGPRFPLTYVLTSGPSRQAIADYLQKKRDEYGRRDTIHCVPYASAGWYEQDGRWNLPLVLYLTTEDRVPGSYVELSRAILEILDRKPVADDALRLSS